MWNPPNCELKITSALIILSTCHCKRKLTDGITRFKTKSPIPRIILMYLNNCGFEDRGKERHRKLPCTSVAHLQIMLPRKALGRDCCVCRGATAKKALGRHTAENGTVLGTDGGYSLWLVFLNSGMLCHPIRGILLSQMWAAKDICGLGFPGHGPEEP